MPVDDRYLKRSTIDRVDAKDLSLEEFVRRYDRPNVPVILTGVVSEWPAVKGGLAWASDDAILSRYGSVEFNVGGYHFPLKDYYEYANKVTDDQVRV